MICGVELTPDALKYAIVENKRGRQRVVSHGRVTLIEGLTPGQALAELQRQSSISVRRVRLALGTQTAHIKMHNFPPMSKADLYQVIQNEIRKELEMIPDEFVYGYEILPRRKKKDPYQVLVALTPREGIAAIEQDLAEQKFEPELITLSSLALMSHVRTLTTSMGNKAVAVLHVGSRLMVLAIVEGDSIRIVRDVAGGIEFKNLNNIQLTGTYDFNNVPEPEELERIVHVLDEIARVSQQIKKTLDYDGTSHPQSPVERLFFTGDVSGVEEIGSILENEIGLPVEMLELPSGLEIADRCVSLRNEGSVYALPLALAATSQVEKIPDLQTRVRRVRFPLGKTAAAAGVWAAVVGSALTIGITKDQVDNSKRLRNQLKEERSALMELEIEPSAPMELLSRLGGWSGVIPQQHIRRLSEILPPEALLMDLSSVRQVDGLILRAQGYIQHTSPERRLEAWNLLLTRLQQEPSYLDVRIDPMEIDSRTQTTRLPFGFTLTVEVP